MRYSLLFAARAFAAVATMGGPVFAAGAIGAPAPDPLLNGTPDGPCKAQAVGPDYVPGTDAQGYPVVPADVGAPPVVIPDQLIVPLPGGAQRQDHYGGHDRRRGRTGRGSGNGIGPYAVIDGHKLEGLLNPPGCGDPMPPARDKR